MQPGSTMAIFYAGFTVAFAPPADGRFVHWVDEVSGAQMLSVIWQGKVSHLVINDDSGKLTLGSHVSQQSDLYIFIILLR